MIEATTPHPARRSNAWLAERLSMLHETYFSDVPVQNRLLVRFGRKTRNRFGSIIAHQVPGERLPVTTITINGLFRDFSIPEFVIDATLLHEFTHYAHGFHSPLPRKYIHPHKGGIVDKEITARGAKDILKLQKQWIKLEYRPYLKASMTKRYLQYT